MFLKRAQWVTDKYILVMLGLFPLFWGFQGYSNITASKFYFFAAATGLWAAALLVLLVLGRIRGERLSLEIRPAHIAVAVFLAVGAVSALFSEYGLTCLVGANRFDGYLTTLMYGAIFFGVSWFSRPRPRYVRVLAVSVGICCVIALFQLGGLDPFHLYPTGTNYYDKYTAYNSAFLGTIGNVGLLAAYLCLSAPLLIIYGVLSEKRWDSLVVLPGALALGILAVCDVDAGIVALAGCVLISVPVVLQNRKASRIAACASGGIAAAGLAGVYFWPGTSGMIWEISQVLHGNLSDKFGSSRGEIWKRCWQLFLEKPWLGGGPGTTSERIQITWSRYIEELGTTRTVAVGNAHNVFLGYLVNIGIFGLLAYLAALGSSMVTWLRRSRSGEIYPALGSAVLCYMIQDFFGLGLSLTAPMLWVVWGLLETGGEE